MTFTNFTWAFGGIIIGFIFGFLIGRFFCWLNKEDKMVEEIDEEPEIEED